MLPESGTTAAIRFPSRGDIIRYGFLFDHQAADKREIAPYARPCFVVSSDPETKLVTVAALSTKGDKYSAALRLPTTTARAIGMSEPDNCSVMLDELNRFEWIGFDVEMIMGKGTPHYGTLSPNLTKAILDAIPSDAIRRWRGDDPQPAISDVEKIPPPESEPTE